MRAAQGGIIRGVAAPPCSTVIRSSTKTVAATASLPLLILAAAIVVAMPRSVRSEPASLAVALTTPADAVTTLNDADAHPFVAWARRHAMPLDSLRMAEQSPARSVSDELATVIGTARLVALGEPTHGAHEPLAVRNDLIKSLVTRHGFTAVALETGFSEAQRVNEFVQGGPGHAAQVVSSSLTWGFGRYAENLELIQWLRQYNEAPGRQRKVSFYGIDLSGGRNADFNNSRIALDRVLEYLSAVAAADGRRLQDRLEPYLDKFTTVGYGALAAAQRDDLRGAVADLVATLERLPEAVIASGSDYEWALRNALVARDLEHLFRVSPPPSPDVGLDSGFYQAAMVRDAAMADNVQWALRHEGPRGRMLVFAHNAHVMAAPLRGGIWSVYPQAPLTMGHFLRNRLGTQLVIVGQSAAANGKGLPPVASATVLDTALDQVGREQFLLDLRATRDAPAVTAWLRQPRSMRANLTTEILIAPVEAFDALVFTRLLTPAGSFTAP